MPLVEPSPTQIAIQIPSGHTFESLQPSLQPAVVGIDVLDMENPFLHPDTSLDIHGLVGNSGILCHSLEGFAPVGAQEVSFPSTGLRAAPRCSASIASRIASKVSPLRSRAIRTGICSTESPGFAAFPPLSRAGLGNSR